MKSHNCNDYKRGTAMHGSLMYNYCTGCGFWSLNTWLRRGCNNGATSWQQLWISVILWLFAVGFWLAHADERIRKRGPELVIGPDEDPQTKRWHIWQWRGWQLAYHEWHRSDHDRALHDHSADNWSIIISGWYDEVLSHRWEDVRMKLRHAFVPYFRRADEPHRVVITPRLLDRGICKTLWLRMPPRREWGFVCKTGWKHNSEYIADRDYYGAKVSVIGKGCD